MTVSCNRFIRHAICTAALLLQWPLAIKGADAPPTPGPQILSIEDCLRIALEKNQRQPASRFAVAMAEAQHRQALAGYWPQVSAKGGWLRTDEPINFVFPASAFYIPPQTVTVPGGSTTVTIPANAFGPGFPPAAVQMPVSFPGQTVTSSAQVLPVPPQSVKLADATMETASVSAAWLLFDGGMRRGYREQAQGAIAAARAEERRTSLEITESVVRLYYGAVLARQVHQLGKDTLARMEATLSLTEALYKESSGTVNRSDYLDNKVMVETVRSLVAELAKNEALSQAALAYTMGLPWNADVRPSAEEVPFRPYAGDLGGLVATAYEFSPDWARVEAGLRALEGAVGTAKSGYYPKVALTGELHRWWNGYQAGIATPENKAGWSIGLGAEIPLFDGFLTKNKVAEARARLNKLKVEKLLLREGIGLQIRNLFLSLDAAAKTHQAAGDAMTAAKENRDLTTRAYQSGLIETEKVIRAQMVEALMSAQYYKARYDHLTLESQIDTIVGKEIAGQIRSAP
jgi:outer membrane protein TolC